MKNSANDLGQGYIQVYTGNGKGKTTAALGLALRAVGRGLRVVFIQFMKRWGYGEHLAADRLSPELELIQVGKPFFVAREEDIDESIHESVGDDVIIFPAGQPPQDLVSLAESGLCRASEIMCQRRADVLVLDEIMVALYYDLLSVADVLKLVEDKPEGVELVMTGRNAPPELIEAADLVTEMKEVKHYFQQGVMSRRGIEE